LYFPVDNGDFLVLKPCLQSFRFWILVTSSLCYVFLARLLSVASFIPSLC